MKNMSRTATLVTAVVLFIACGAFAQTPAQTSNNLAGTSWRLVKFRGGDDTTLTPDDPAKYTITFGADGSLSARIDCNRGRGKWKSSGPSQLELGPLALTRAKCPPGSLHDQIVKQWSNIRSYVLKDGHLFLSLMADGGIYEFEPTPPAAPAGKRPLEKTYWAATELAGKPVATALAGAAREPHLVFEQGGRVSGSDSCNRVTGTYELSGDAIKFGRMAGTQMACSDTAATERAFRDALQNASRLKIAGDGLELYDKAGVLVARFRARAKP
jgi:heat shock protein HslJ